MDYKEYFKGKRITIMGLGLLGRAVGDVKFLAGCVADLIVTDLKSTEDLKTSLDELKSFKNISYTLGGHKLEDFRDRDFVLKAAGVPLDSPFIAEARKNNIPIEMSGALFAALTSATVVGVTGTRGKTTVTHLLYEILRAHVTKDQKVFLGGNVRGGLTLPLLKEAKKDDVAVLELDSWQLQGFGEIKISPHVSVFTTFMDDHLNYYKGDVDAYLADKVNIFKYQTDKDFLVLGDQCADLVQKKYPDIKSNITIANSYDISYELAIPGEHNRYNAACARAAAVALGVPDEIIKKTIAEFKGVPGRLEFVREINGVKIYNDTTATTPDATIAGLKALGSPTTLEASRDKIKKIVLILGGADKGLDMSKLVEVIPEYCKALILLAGTGSEKIKSQISNLKSDMRYADTLEKAVKLAIESSEAGDTILFSPAFASFGMFKNEYDRGDQFNAIIQALS